MYEIKEKSKSIRITGNWKKEEEENKGVDKVRELNYTLMKAKVAKSIS